MMILGRPGGEAEVWPLWVTGYTPFTSLHWLAAEGFMKYMIYNDPEWDFRSWDYARDLPAA